MTSVSSNELEVFQNAFKSGAKSNPRLKDALYKWRDTFTDDKISRKLLQGICDDCAVAAVAEIKRQLLDTCADAKESANAQLNEELVEALRDALQKICPHGEIFSTEELSSSWQASIDIVLSMQPPSSSKDQQQEILRSAKLLLTVQKSIKFDDFTKWFVDYFGSQAEAADENLSPVSKGTGESPALADLSRVRAALEAKRGGHTLSNSAAVVADSSSGDPVRKTEKLQQRKQVTAAELAEPVQET